jgi:hypothetical protein
VSWRKLADRLRSGSVIEPYIQRYIQPFKDYHIIFRLTFYCNPEKSRKASYVQMLKQKSRGDSQFWDYTDFSESNSEMVYKKLYNGIHELTYMAKQINQLANVVFFIYLTGKKGIWI